MTYDYAVTEVLRVVDGDTVDLRVDLGFHMTAALRFRVLDLDTPERGQPGWSEATAFTRMWLTQSGPYLRVSTYKADSFGRWLGEVYVPAGSPTPTMGTLAGNVVEVMREAYGIDARWHG